MQPASQLRRKIPFGLALTNLLAFVGVGLPTIHACVGSCTVEMSRKIAILRLQNEPVYVVFLVVMLECSPGQRFHRIGLVRRLLPKHV